MDEWNQYLSGDVYGYVIEHNGEHVDSCWGFYGLDNCKQEAVDSAEYAAKYEADEARKTAEVCAL